MTSFSSDGFELASRRHAWGDQLAVFSVLWALAHSWHVVGNPTLAPGWSQLALAGGVLLVLLRPGAVVPLAALAAIGLVTVWLEAPLLGNHWLLVGFVDLAVLVAVAVAVARRRPWDRVDLATRLLPVARLSLLGFYGFAAFAKLNSAFFDRSVSCAVVFFGESTDSVGLSRLQLGGAAWVEHAVIVATAGIELAIPVLLLVRRTRHLGVLLGLVFHLVLALDRTHQFFDFSSVLVALFVLFLAPAFGTWVVERVGSIRARLALDHHRLPVFTHLALVAIPVAGVATVAVARVTYDQGVRIGYVPFVAYNLVLLGAALRYTWQARPRDRTPLLPHHPAFLLVPLLVVANGLAPYVELKTGYGWNMYANLRTVDGDSNHFLVRRTLPLTGEHADVVEILATDDARLAWYGEHGYGLTWRSLRGYLADRPEVSLHYRRGGEEVRLDRASEDPDLVRPVPQWRRKLQPFRAVDLRSPPERCVTTFGPIGV